MQLGNGNSNAWFASRSGLLANHSAALSQLGHSLAEEGKRMRNCGLTATIQIKF